MGSIPTPGTRKPRIVRGFFCLEPLGLHGRTLHGMTPLITDRPCWVAALLALTNTLGHAQVTVNSTDLPQGGTTYTFQDSKATQVTHHLGIEHVSSRPQTHLLLATNAYPQLGTRRNNQRQGPLAKGASAWRAR